MFNSISPEVSNFALEQNTCDFVSYTLLNNVEQHVQIYHEKKWYFTSFYALQFLFWKHKHNQE